MMNLLIFSPPHASLGPIPGIFTDFKLDNEFEYEHWIKTSRSKWTTIQFRLSLSRN